MRKKNKLKVRNSLILSERDNDKIEKIRKATIKVDINIQIIEAVSKSAKRRKLKPLPSQEYLKENYKYDPETGDFTERGTGYTGSVGKRYRTIFIQGQNYLVHRLIYKYMTGMEPEIIDHKHGHTFNNRWKNLINGDSGTNARNRRKSINSYKNPGVKELPSGLWSSSITINRKTIRLGKYKTEDEAVKARQEIIDKYPELGFTERHCKSYL